MKYNSRLFSSCLETCFLLRAKKVGTNYRVDSQHSSSSSLNSLSHSEPCSLLMVTLLVIYFCLYSVSLLSTTALCFQNMVVHLATLPSHLSPPTPYCTSAHLTSKVVAVGLAHLLNTLSFQYRTYFVQVSSWCVIRDCDHGARKLILYTQTAYRDAIFFSNLKLPF